VKLFNGNRSVFKSKWFWLSLLLFAFVMWPSRAEAGWVDWVPGLNELLDVIRSAVISAFEALKDLFEAIFTPMFEAVLAVIDFCLGPVLPGSGVATTVARAIGSTNYWFPMTEMLSMLACYYAGVMVFAGFKWVIKIAPFVG